MLARIMAKKDLKQFIEKLIASKKVIALKEKDERYAFDEIRKFEEWVDEEGRSCKMSILPPKKFFFPQKETMFKFNIKDNSVVDSDGNIETVYFGLHPCDISGILLLDKIFMEDYVDSYYKLKREKSIIIGLNCLPAEECFCYDAGTSEVHSGFDLFFTDLGNFYHIYAGTVKGMELLDKSGVKTTEITAEEQRKYKVFMNERDGYFKSKADMSNLADIYDEKYESSVWDDFGSKCVGCGGCSFVCPTCYCYNVSDNMYYSLKEGERNREWDSCFKDNFALVAGGHNFRGPKTKRFRQRYVHKERTFIEKYRSHPCVGCGRCAMVCMAGIKPTDVFNQLRKVEVK